VIKEEKEGGEQEAPHFHLLTMYMRDIINFVYG